MKLLELNPCDVEEKYWYDKPFWEVTDPTKNVRAYLDVNTHDMNKRVYGPSSKCPTLTCIGGGYHHKKVFQDQRCRKLTPLEYSLLQTVDPKYIEDVKLSDTAIYSALGNGWTNEVIKFILKGKF